VSALTPGDGDAGQTGMSTLEPLRSETLGMQAADAIRRLIATGQLAGGERLIEARIAERLGISRGSVRDALWLLRGQGLVRDEPRRGSFVAELNAKDVRDIYDLRIAVELAAVRILVQRPRAEALRPLEQAIEDMRAGGRDAARAADADLGFHSAVCAASGNSRLHDVYVRHGSELLILLRLDEEKLGHQHGLIAGDHKYLLDALLSGDPATAEVAFRSHLEEARDRVAAYVEHSGVAGRRPATG
jgi:GntR family transcriptional regulator, gluconate operon transcriptional repressor